MQVKSSKRKVLSLIIAMAMVIGMMPATLFAVDFSDVSGHWGQAAIERWTEYGILNGYEDGTFKPEKLITRAEVAKILDAAIGYQDLGTTSFNDVNEGSWYYEHIMRLAEAGVMQGSAGNARPGDNITRQEAVVLIARAFAITGGADSGAFADDAAIAEWAKAAVQSMKDNGYVQGDEGGFRPGDSIKRAELVTILSNVLSGYYNAEGTYEGVETIAGNVAVAAADVVLKDIVIEGDLYVLQGVGEGDASFENITVKGTVHVWGGGANSVYFKGSTIATLAMAKDEARVVLQDGTSVEITLAEAGELLTQRDVTIGELVVGEGVKATIGNDVTVEKATVTGELENLGTIRELTVEDGTVVNTGTLTKVELTGAVSFESTDAGKIGEITVSEDVDAESTIKLDSPVDKLVVDTTVDITGKGKIDQAEINADSVTIETEPVKVTVSDDVTVKPEFETAAPVDPGSGDGGSGGSDPIVIVKSLDASNVTLSAPAQDVGTTFIGKTATAVGNVVESGTSTTVQGTWKITAVEDESTYGTTTATATFTPTSSSTTYATLRKTFTVEIKPTAAFVCAEAYEATEALFVDVEATDLVLADGVNFDIFDEAAELYNLLFNLDDGIDDYVDELAELEDLLDAAFALLLEKVDDAVAKINDGNATLQDYVDAEIKGVTAANLDAINTAVAAAKAEKGSALDLRDIQTVVNGVIAAEAIAKINAGTATVQDFVDAEITGVTEANLVDVKAAIAEAKEDAGADLTKAQIQTVVTNTVDLLANKAAVNAAKALLEEAAYEMSNGAGVNETDAKSAAVNAVGDLNLNGVTATIADGATFTAAVNGTETAQSGVDGSYKFKFELGKGTGATLATGETKELTLVIKAVPYEAPPADNFITAVTIDGIAKVGETLSAKPTIADGVPSPAVTYQWQISDSADTGYANIDGATNATYVIAAGDLGKYIKVVATQTGATGSPFTSAATAAVAAADNFIAGVTISGTAKVGETLTAVPTVDGTANPAVTYQWQISESADTGYANIAGATNGTYEIAVGDQGKYIKVIATQAGATDSPFTSAATAAVAAADNFITGVTISGTAKVGETLTAVPTVDGTANPVVTYQWQISESADTGYANIDGATNATYEIAVDDQGKYIKVVATQAGATGSPFTSAAFTVPALEKLTVELTAGNGKVYLAPQIVADGYKFLYTSSSTALATKPTYGASSSTIGGSKELTTIVEEVTGANEAAIFVQVYKIETTGNTIVGFGEASATPNATVTLADGSVAGAKVADQMIFDLTPDNYYTLQVGDSAAVPVKANGSGQITGLSNDKIYKVLDNIDNLEGTGIATSFYHTNDSMLLINSPISITGGETEITLNDSMKTGITNPLAALAIDELVAFGDGDDDDFTNSTFSVFYDAGAQGIIEYRCFWGKSGTEWFVVGDGNDTTPVDRSETDDFSFAFMPADYIVDSDEDATDISGQFVVYLAVESGVDTIIIKDHSEKWYLLTITTVLS